tara:strand:+ start:348 stop:545 length:198 start_codon:yes stop_codon:yes gene_type:complete
MACPRETISRSQRFLKRNCRIGNETKTDYAKMMEIVLDAGFCGYVGIEFDRRGDEAEGIKKNNHY